MNSLSSEMTQVTKTVSPAAGRKCVIVDSLKSLKRCLVKISDNCLANHNGSTTSV